MEKRIKNRVLKRVRVLEQMQHKELIKRIAKLEKRKAKILGLNVEGEKPGTFSKHKEPGFKDDEEKDDACEIIIEKGKEALDDAIDAYKEEEPSADDDEARDYVLECYEKHLKKQKGGLAVCEPIKR